MCCVVSPVWTACIENVACGGTGTTPETPTLVAAPKEAGQELRPVPGERSPQPKGQRPRSAQRQVESHPLHISSNESFETELGPLGRSMEAGPLKQVPHPSTDAKNAKLSKPVKKCQYITKAKKSAPEPQCLHHPTTRGWPMSCACSGRHVR